ncbi:lactate racemase domain-containing protein [Leadbettera azotonutricia]|uniref:Iron-sulfur cluster-binding protein n=1 Tax=Leadbettera azotonutricia (strain ATCC BAA-888 / DSM 13862 / ZAS-9) TaxID=545695 RepID=F5Y6T0_LEAAZ|nr:lactate racemase domain-containing protein [Leadbettera azotonutricia]AEF82797.1 iron-sulfur cluster-binding protein [Leadbettera azotonutricia ZAS-9]
MYNIIPKLCNEIKLPRMLKVKQLFDTDKIEADRINEAVLAELSRPRIAARIKPGMKVAITCGSRGISNIALIIKSIAGFVKSRGAHPFIIPAMGSHGGATAEGQRALIEGYGVTEDFVGCPIVSSMETVVIGKSEEGHGVRLDRNAAEADAIIVSGRIKPHTDFRGTYESGLMKMMTIGLGKREGADMCHEKGFGHMHSMMPLFARCILKNAPIALGLGILENAYYETYKIVALEPEEFETREPLLLEEARSHLPLIQFDSADVLVVDRIGKDISGDGMDPNITGANHCTPYVSGGLKAQRTVILDLTDATHGAAFGVGIAHTTTRRLFNKIDFEATYINAITATVLDFARIPCILDTDREAVQLAVRTCNGIDKQQPRIIRIPDSVHTSEIWISEGMKQEAEKNPRLEILAPPEAWPFDKDGNLW